jgi:putative ABC transport system substrate-binding protein
MNEFMSMHAVSRATFAERTLMARHDIIAVAGFMAGAGLIAAAMVAPWNGARAQLDGRGALGLPVVGFFNVQPAAMSARYVAAFRDGLEDAGYVDGREVRIEYRWADGDDRKANMMASELAARRVAVIAATGGLRPAQPSADGAPGIPALFIAGAGQPTSRPGRNLTGDRLDAARMAAKRLELLRELMPPGGKVAMLVIHGGFARTGWAGGRRSWQPELEAAESQGAVVLRIRNPQEFDRELDEALTGAVRDGVRGFVVSADPFFTSRRGSIVALAARHGLAALYPSRLYVEAGGLASYGPDLVDMYHQIGMYTGQILKGAQPDSLPVVSPRKWDLTINRRAAAALRIEVPPRLIARANETID